VRRASAEVGIDRRHDVLLVGLDQRQQAAQPVASYRQRRVAFMVEGRALAGDEVVQAGDRILVSPIFSGG
jgi:sulfur carrier protein ThiS